jgi:murein DD-endopeptidase MepM/ murein hydrolase activator NlpD
MTPWRAPARPLPECSLDRRGPPTRAVPSIARAVVVVVVVTALPGVGAACAGTVRPATWEDVGPGPGAIAGAGAAAPSDDEGDTDAMVAAPITAAARATSSGALIDRALVEFHATRAAARRQGRTSPLWGEAWLDVLARIDDALTRAPVAPDLGAFVRARVTLEVELQHDREREVVLPGPLSSLVERTLLGVDDGVAALRAANAPGTLAPSPRLTDDELVLHAPIAPIVVNSPFGRRIDPFTGAPRFHSGVDLDGAVGSAVYAAASAIVVYAGAQGGYGKTIVLDHGDGVRTHYAHLSAIHVEVGGFVAEGEVIGAVGSTGRSTGPHLHFAVTDDLGAFLDPLAVLDIPFRAIAAQVARKGEAPADVLHATPAEAPGDGADAPDGG